MKLLHLVRCAARNAFPFWLLCASKLVAADLDDRIEVDCTVNGKPAHFVFDTGTSEFTLFTKAANRLGISFQHEPGKLGSGPAEIQFSRSEECELGFSGVKTRTRFVVTSIPSMLAFPVDGLIGWAPMSQNVVLIDGFSRKVTYLPEVPAQTAKWTKLRVQTNAWDLRLEWLSPGGKSSHIEVDTGFPGGVTLCPERWRAWKAAHSTQAKTLVSYYTPHAGLVISEEAWASTLSFGPLALTGLPVQEANAGEVALGGNGYEGTIGLWALKRMTLVVDGKNGVGYVAPTKKSPAYNHNRLGAVFVPADLEQGEDLICRVVEDSPAYTSGIRNGDVLLKIGDLDVTKWRTDRKVLPLGRFWQRPAGTKLKLTVRRGAEQLEKRVTLREILGP